jgi:hypothetical protein
MRNLDVADDAIPCPPLPESGAHPIFERKHHELCGLALVFGMGAGVLLTACGGSHAKDEKTETPSIISPLPEYEMSKIPEASSAAPKATEGEAAPAPPTPSAKKPKGMQPLFTNDKEVSTVVGTQGAVFRVADATLRIPADALRDGKDIHLALSPTPPAKDEPARLGTAFTVGPALASVGPPFELVLPFPADAGEVVLITLLRPKTKDKKAKTDVSTLAPKSVDPSKREALFELAALPEADVYLAKKPASSASSPEPSATSSAAPPAASANAPPRH